jgi:hypothetical protein
MDIRFQTTFRVVPKDVGMRKSQLQLLFSLPVMAADWICGLVLWAVMTALVSLALGRPQRRGQNNTSYFSGTQLKTASREIILNPISYKIVRECPASAICTIYKFIQAIYGFN